MGRGAARGPRQGRRCGLVGGAGRLGDGRVQRLLPAGGRVAGDLAARPGGPRPGVVSLRRRRDARRPPGRPGRRDHPRRRPRHRCRPGRRPPARRGRVAGAGRAVAPREGAVPRRPAHPLAPGRGRVTAGAVGGRGGHAGPRAVLPAAGDPDGRGGVRGSARPDAVAGQRDACRHPARGTGERVVRLADVDAGAGRGVPLAARWGGDARRGPRVASAGRGGGDPHRRTRRRTSSSSTVGPGSSGRPAAPRSTPDGPSSRTPARRCSTRSC